MGGATSLTILTVNVTFLTPAIGALLPEMLLDFRHATNALHLKLPQIQLWETAPRCLGGLLEVCNWKVLQLKTSMVNQS